MMTLDEEAQRVRGYLVSQAAKLSVPDLVAKLRRDTEALREASSKLNAGQFGQHPIAGEWSAAEVWTHVLEMNEQGAATVTRMIESGEVPPAVEDAISGATRSGLASSEDYWRAFGEVREPLYERVLKATGEEHLDVKAESSFGDLNWREWLLFMRIHDLDHSRQLETIAAAFNS